MILKHLSATRISASSIGALAGFAGMEHGFFEIIQGNVKTGGLIINAIGSSQRFWELGGECAFTIIPNFLITGILAMFMGMIVIVWSITFIHRKFAAWILMSLSIIMFLVGGGFAPPVLAILAIILATRINKPLKWAKKYLPRKLLAIFAWLWPWSLIGLPVSMFTCP
jgi:hypothetical protein